MRYLAFLTIFALLITACQTESTAKLQPLNLLKYGVPVTIMAPDSVNVKTMDLLVQKDITITGEDDGYYLQIFASDATTTDAKRVASELKAEVQNNPYFKEFILEEDKGFIYKTVIDSTQTSYGFQQVRIQGDREFIFQNGLIGTFTQEEAQAMYNAVKPQPKK